MAPTRTLEAETIVAITLNGSTVSEAECSYVGDAVEIAMVVDASAEKLTTLRNNDVTVRLAIQRARAMNLKVSIGRDSTLSIRSFETRLVAVVAQTMRFSHEVNEPWITRTERLVQTKSMAKQT